MEDIRPWGGGGGGGGPPPRGGGGGGGGAGGGGAGPPAGGGGGGGGGGRGGGGPPPPPPPPPPEGRVIPQSSGDLPGSSAWRRFVQRQGSPGPPRGAAAGAKRPEMLGRAAAGRPAPHFVWQARGQRPRAAKRRRPPFTAPSCPRGWVRGHGLSTGGHDQPLNGAVFIFGHHLGVYQLALGVIIFLIGDRDTAPPAFPDL